MLTPELIGVGQFLAPSLALGGKETRVPAECAEGAVDLLDQPTLIIEYVLTWSQQGEGVLAGVVDVSHHDGDEVG